MLRFNGIGISDGITISSKVKIKKGAFEKQKPEKVKKYYFKEDEMDFFLSAKKELVSMYSDAMNKSAASDIVSLVEAWKMLAEDSELEKEVLKNINEENLSAEDAIRRAHSKFIRLFESADDDYLKARTDDIDGLCDQLTDIIARMKEEDGVDIDQTIRIGVDVPKETAFRTPEKANEKYILIADELTPAEFLKLTDELDGIALKKGNALGHTAILARMYNIPMVVGISDLEEAVKADLSKVTGIIDGYTGEVIVDPDDASVKIALNKIEETDNYNEELQKYVMVEPTTKAGVRIKVYANISDSAEAYAAKKQGAMGVGLFRTEFMFLNRTAPPTEEEQLKVYKETLEIFKDSEVIIRLADLGADKNAEYLHMPHEENPALGVRGVRLLLQHPDLLMTQLRALLRAGAYGNLGIMIPMVNSNEEVLEVKRLYKKAQNDLYEEGFYYVKDIRFGIMIETPAAALISDVLSREVDFFSIGTNDLTQYTLATDRQNPNLNTKNGVYSDAVMRLISHAVYNAHEANIPVGICGEAASDINMFKFYEEIKLDAVSVETPLILETKKEISNM